ncbi:MAG: phosphatase PAP2 family protein [Alphaproteobacteria bacterium]|nr:MAG: phosphatase PAP2 family protein [Alphaproteobacteria bacterium]
MIPWRRLLSVDRALLLALVLIAAALFTFFKLASEVGEGETMALDGAILLWLRTSANPAIPAGPHWLTEAMTETTAFGSVTGLLLVMSAVIGFLLISRRHRTALFVLLATGGGTTAAKLLKLLYDRPRPGLVPHLVDVSTASFPSGHSADSAIVYLTIAALLARTVPQRALRLYILGAAGLLVLLIGVSRVYLGVHWPSDVVAGWAFGAAWALGCSLAYSRLWARQGLAEVEKR